MRVKVGNSWFEATAEQPIAVGLSPNDRRNVEAMPEEATRYAVFASDDPRTSHQMREWLQHG